MVRLAQVLVCLINFIMACLFVSGDFVERAAALGGARLHTCNFCDYLTNKMSNIKQHLRGVHKQIERDPGDEGFTTVMRSDLYGHNSQ